MPADTPAAIPTTSLPTTPIATEALRMEESSLFSGKGHFEAGKRWTRCHLWLGIPATVLAAAAGAAALQSVPAVTAGLALVSAILTALMTFLNPQERANAHNLAGGDSLRFVMKFAFSERSSCRPAFRRWTQPLG